MSLKDFVGAVGGADPKAAGRSAKKTGRKKKVNTRTAEGRETLDKAISEFLASSKTARAGEIRKAVGGTSHQVRQSVSRLMAAKRVTRKGQKRGTEYSWRGRAAKSGPAGVRAKGRRTKQTR